MAVSRKPYRLLAIDLEPAPYKFDLWNAFAKSNEFSVQVLFTNAKDHSRDAGHNYQEFPLAQFPYRVLLSHSIWASLKKIICTVKAIIQNKVDGVFIAGYVDIAPLSAIFICLLIRKSFFLHSDIFNLNTPKPPLRILKLWSRLFLRYIIFKQAKGILVCGKLGYESAVAARCPISKIIDFPYVVDRERLNQDSSVSVPDELLQDLQGRRMVLYFSGRMIARKGLLSLLKALALYHKNNSSVAWVLWVAGDGPLLSEYQNQADLFGLGQHVRFLGFVQMSLHTWLLKKSSIVVIPSLADAWGIVVDEGMQLGKVVIASNTVGSAVDRIHTESNGILFSADNFQELAKHLEEVIASSAVRKILGDNAKMSSRDFSPQRNVANLSRLLGLKSESIC
jgi:glycosyltransferase involved in cell wall biosynthesis